MSGNDNGRGMRCWPDYRTVWRWHFYAGLFCIPFVVFLAVTGSIYLFKPQIESYLDRPYNHLAATVPVERLASPSRQIEAALAAVPGGTFSAYELPPSPDSAGRVLVQKGKEIVRVYVHPETLQILHTVPENSRLMKVIFRLHGELLLGNGGSMVVELAASWSIVMIVSGLYLWWPRNASGLGGIVYPRLGRGTRMFWRDVHSVVGVWVSGLALFMLLTGLPWAKFWGDYYKEVRHLAGAAMTRQDWTNGSTAVADVPDGALSGEHAEHSGMAHHHGGMMMTDFTAVDRIVPVVGPLRLAPPVLIADTGSGGRWSVQSLADDRPKRSSLVVEGRTGKIVSRTDFSERPLADRVVGTGIAAHEGQLFGWANQLLGLLTAMGLILLCVSAVILWWKRREEGVLGAPKFVVRRGLALTFFCVLAAFAMYLPMFGISMVLVVIVEKTILRRMGRVGRWLGLRAAGAGLAGMT